MYLSKRRQQVTLVSYLEITGRLELEVSGHKPSYRLSSVKRNQDYDVIAKPAHTYTWIAHTHSPYGQHSEPISRRRVFP